MLRSPSRALGGLASAGLPGTRWAVRTGLGRVFGPPRADLRAGAGDPGLFGPGSASWRVVAEPASIVGGVRALLVQLLHPLAMAGVADHSTFRTDPLGRLNRTSAYVTATTFGAMPQVLATARTVREVHRSVTGVAPDGREYRADDPHLVTWVSVALTSSFLATDRAYAPRPIDPAGADTFVAEQARAAALLDERVDLDALARNADARAALAGGELPLPMLAEGRLPQTAAELDACLASFAGELEATSQSREALRFLLWPELAPAVRAGYLPVLAGAVATLEASQRRLLGLPLGPAAWPLAAQTRGLLAAFRLAAGTSPALAAARARVAAEG